MLALDVLSDKTTENQPDKKLMFSTLMLQSALRVKFIDSKMLTDLKRALNYAKDAIDDVSLVKAVFPAKRMIMKAGSRSIEQQSKKSVEALICAASLLISIIQQDGRYEQLLKVHHDCCLLIWL